MRRPDFVMPDYNDHGYTKLAFDDESVSFLEDHIDELDDHAYVLETGRIVMEGPSKDLANDPRIKEAYLGE